MKHCSYFFHGLIFSTSFSRPPLLGPPSSLSFFLSSLLLSSIDPCMCFTIITIEEKNSIC
uniref:Uncharacterized protein n=1 Tax=Medicago truncatula TaxID=3880 RepID=A2Q4K8_MEDTR|nr:hypothetical protein MtrDRAFT_AC157503g31v2 [Medicago truncatula]